MNVFIYNIGERLLFAGWGVEFVLLRWRLPVSVGGGVYFIILMLNCSCKSLSFKLNIFMLAS